MNFFSGLVHGFFALILVAQPSYQCTCDWWNWKTLDGEPLLMTYVDGENIAYVLCDEDQTFIVFKADKKEIVPGDFNSERVVFDITVSKVITKASGEQVIPGGRKITLEAPTSGQLCGYINFEIGVTGILSVFGPLKDKMDYTACHYYLTETELTSVQRRVMSGELKCQGHL